MKIRPLHDRLIVRRKEEERTTASGIVIPESASAEKPDQGLLKQLVMENYLKTVTLENLT
jgi:chaperonin GroES